MAPPLPAASQPSNTHSTGTWRLKISNSSSRMRTCSFPICSSYCFSVSFLFISMRSSMGDLFLFRHGSGGFLFFATRLLLFHRLLLFRARQLGVALVLGRACHLG